MERPRKQQQRKTAKTFLASDPYPPWEEEVDWSPDTEQDRHQPTLGAAEPSPFHSGDWEEEVWWGEEEAEEDEELLAFYQDEGNDAGISSDDEEAIWVYAEDLTKELDADAVEMSWMAFAEAKRALHQRRLSRRARQRARASRKAKGAPANGENKVGCPKEDKQKARRSAHAWPETRGARQREWSD